MDAALEQLSEDVRDYWSPTAESALSGGGDSIQRVEASQLSALDFYRDYVSRNKPVILTGLVDHWTTALTCWQDDDYICKSTASTHQEDESTDVVISVNVTPTGWGDCVQRVGNEDLFVQPEERQMKMAEFLQILNNDDNDNDDNNNNESFDGVAYISHQNDSLRQQFPGLLKDMDEVLPLAREAFASMPEAINLWMGNEKAVSSLHKDHYENMYVVIEGEKHFLLFPPADVAFLENGVDDQHFRTARYVHANTSSCCNEQAAELFEKALSLPSSSSWRVLVDEDDDGSTMTTPWIRPFESSGPPRRTSPVHAVVRKGEVLYLPALWYHQVSQRGRTIAVNYWHDMVFDHKWVYHNFVRNVAQAAAAAAIAAACSEAKGEENGETKVDATTAAKT